MSKLHEITAGLRDVAEGVVGRGRAYLEQFVGAMAWNVLAAIESAELGISTPEQLAHEVEAQALAVAETLEELTDHAARLALVRAVAGATRLALAAIRPTP